MILSNGRKALSIDFSKAEWVQIKYGSHFKGRMGTFIHHEEFDQILIIVDVLDHKTHCQIVCIMTKFV